VRAHPHNVYQLIVKGHQGLEIVTFWKLVAPFLDKFTPQACDIKRKDSTQKGAHYLEKAPLCAMDTITTSYVA